MSVLEEKAQCALMEAAKRLKPERLAEPISPAEHRRTEGGSVRNRKISRPEHWNVPRGHSSAEIVKSILFAMKRQDWHGVLKN